MEPLGFRFFKSSMAIERKNRLPTENIIYCEKKKHTYEPLYFKQKMRFSTEKIQKNGCAVFSHMHIGQMRHDSRNGMRASYKARQKQSYMKVHD